MKKINVLIFVLTLLAALILCAAFTGCDRDKQAEQTSAPDGNGETNDPSTEATDPSTEGKPTDAPETPETPEEETPKNIVIGGDFLTKYRIIKTESQQDTEIAKKLSELIKSKTGKTVLMSTDTFSDAREYEILLGETNRPESAEVYDGTMRDKEFKIALKGNKIVIAALNPETLSVGVEYFASLFANGELSLPEGYCYAGDTYESDRIKIDGVSITEYKIIYAEKGDRSSADFLVKEIKELTGETVSAVSDSSARGKYEIIIDTTNRGKVEACNEYYSYKIRTKGSALYIKGYDKYAIDNAIAKLISTFKKANGSVSLGELELTYELPEYTEYIEDIDKLYMRWIAEWEPDPRMLDYGLKIDAFKNVSDRLMTCAHRADGYYYPENSIEAIISFYKMGGDVVELDIGTTKDNVLILMHDNNLKRMTNAVEFVGKTVDGIKFPDSYKVEDWTYEQIKYLNLKEGKGGNTNITPFKVPTLVEALKVCKNRLFVIPDKTNKWRYTENDCLTGSPNVFLFDAMKEADNYESIFLSYGLTASSAVEVQDYIFKKSGVVPLILVRDNAALSSTYTTLKNNAIKSSFGIHVGGTFNPDNTSATKPTFQAWRHEIMLWGWTISDEVDSEQYWRQMYGLGYRMIMVNAYLDFVKFAATTVSFDER